MKTSDLYLVHHGIMGQKWGKKNGPPYPLDFKKLSEEERAKAKSDTIRKGDIKTAHVNRDYYTDQELRSVKDRFDLNMRVSELNKKYTKTGMDKVENIVNNIDRIVNMGEKAVKGYNLIARLSNTFGDTDLPIIKKDNKNK